MTLPSITGAILSGGRATRMGGVDKGLVLFEGLPLYQHVLYRLKPQVQRVIISANRNRDEYRKSGCTVLSDTIEGYHGPLAGMLTVLENSPTQWVLFSPCDAPLIPNDLAQRLWYARKTHSAVYVYDGHRAHPTIALLDIALAPSLRDYLLAGNRKLMNFLLQHQAIAADFQDNPDAFANINTLDEL